MLRDDLRLHRSLAVLAPPRRFQLMLLLLGGVERSVSQLARAVRLSQSCTTRHLQALARAGLVKGTRDGKRVVFRPEPLDDAARSVIESLAARAEGGPAPAGRTGSRGAPGAGARARDAGRARTGRNPSRRGRVRPATPPPAIVPVASTAERDPLPDAPDPRGAEGPSRARSPGRATAPGYAPDREPPAPAGSSGQGAPESDMQSTPSGGPAWARSEIEDFLL